MQIAPFWIGKQKKLPLYVCSFTSENKKEGEAGVLIEVD
ncbi:hypothetical protein J2S10_001526 [Neobacillus ginsengisoli]|uniref:Uncharacterized protein n=1 Tax=Neobacillus ginsengisoli TaxID=904295 RepID=A0ABT9XS51_9BACI|nr:hypothetical protein [Neobacillus ginsengisoli]